MSSIIFRDKRCSRCGSHERYRVTRACVPCTKRRATEHKRKKRGIEPPTRAERIEIIRQKFNEYMRSFK